MTARYDWTINQGETTTLTYSQSLTANGNAVDFNTATTWRMQVKPKLGDPAVFTAVASNFIFSFNTSLSPTGNNTFDIKLTAVDTAAIPAGKYLYDVEAVNYPLASQTPADVTRLLEGSFFVRGEVTTDA